jgi:hypothetical protein
MALALGTGSNGIAFLVSAGIVYEIIAKDVSSPQTAELNAKKRAPTLMKWVHIGQLESAAFIAIACYFEPKQWKPIVIGGILAGAITELEYQHAKKSGLANPGPPTEEYPAETQSTIDQAAIGGTTAALVSSAF